MNLSYSEKSDLNLPPSPHSPRPEMMQLPKKKMKQLLNRVCLIQPYNLVCFIHPLKIKPLLHLVPFCSTLSEQGCSTSLYGKSFSLVLLTQNVISFRCAVQHVQHLPHHFKLVPNPPSHVPLYGRWLVLVSWSIEGNTLVQSMTTCF